MEKIEVPDSHDDCAPILAQVPPEKVQNIYYTLSGAYLVLVSGDVVALWRDGDGLDTFTAGKGFKEAYMPFELPGINAANADKFWQFIT